MHQLKFGLIVLVLFMASGRCLGQKSGYISIDEVVQLMPEIPQIKTALQQYQTDSLSREFNTRMAEYRYKDSLMNKTDTTKIPVATRAQYRQNLQILIYQLQNWQSLSQQAIEAKKGQLLDPVYKKVIAAVQSTAKEKGYAFVFTKDALVIGPPPDDLLPMVAAKLGITLQGNPVQKKQTGNKKQ